MAYGDLGAAVIDSDLFDAVAAQTIQLFKRADGILVVFNSSGGADGYCRTYPVATDGTIGARIAELEFEPVTYAARQFNIAEVATGIYLAVYRGAGDVMTAKTISVSADGATLAVVDTLVTALPTTVAVECLAKKGTTNTCYVAVWHDAAQDGQMATLTCDADGSNIAEADNWEFEETRGYLPQVGYIGGDIFAISYTDTDGKGQISTVSVADDGTIAEDLIDTQEVDVGGAVNIGILKVDNGDLVALTYTGAGSDGWIATLTIDTLGNISAIIDTDKYDDVDSTYPRVQSLGTAAAVSYVVVQNVNSATDDCELYTYSMTGGGTLTAIDSVALATTISSIPYGGVMVQPNIWAFARSTTPGNDGYFHTVSVETVPDFSDDGVYVELAGIEVQSQAYGIRVERGRETELTYAPAGVAELTMDNSSGDFSPENAAGAYYPTLDLGNSIYIYEIYGGVTYKLFTGTIEKIVPQAVPGDGGAEAFMICTDGTDDLNDTPVDTPLRTDEQAGQLVIDILDAASAFVGARDIDTGISTFEVAFFSSISALKEIRSVEDQERGRFYIDVDGDAQFEDRHHRILNHRVSEYDFGERLKDIQYEWSKRDLYNFIQLAGIQYTADPDNLYLWGTIAGIAGVAVVVPGNGSVTIWATFGQALASFVPFVQGTHWNTNTAIDKTGTDTSGSVTVATTQYGKAIKIVFTSTFASDSYLVVPDTPPAEADADRSAIVMGKLYTEELIQHEDEDATSQTAYGKKGMSLSAPFISDPDKLRTLASFLKARFKDPQPMAIRVTVHGRTDWPTDDILKQVLSRKISDRVTLASTLLGFDQDFYIEKVIHDWKQFEGKFDLDVTWVCSRASDLDDLVWLLEIAGFGELEETTYLGY